MAQNPDIRPTVSDLQEEENQWVALAKKLWLDRSQAPKPRPEVVKKDIWDALESEGFSLRSLLILENLHILERY
jgi:intron-binding protein aquarius